jgi:hypothetical protein
VTSYHSQSEDEHCSSDDHEPACRDGSEESDDTKKEEKYSQYSPHPEREHHDLLVVGMDPYSIEYLFDLLFV